MFHKWLAASPAPALDAEDRLARNVGLALLDHVIFDHSALNERGQFATSHGSPTLL
jgi:hypothetical protein